MDDGRCSEAGTCQHSGEYPRGEKRQASHLTTVPVRHGAACAILTVVDEGGPNCVLARGDSPGIKRGRYQTLSRYDTNGS